MNETKNSEHFNFRELPEGWETKELSECIELVIDYRGKTPKKLGGDWACSGFRALSAKNVKQGSIVQEESIRHVDKELYSKWMKDEVQREDLLLTSEGPMGESLLWDDDEKIVLSQRLFGVRVDKDILYPRYFHAYVASSIFQQELRKRATGTTVQGIRQSELLRTTVIVPPMNIQKYIGDTCYQFQQQILLSHRENQTLEAIGQAVFERWFVDFEFPNEEGKPYKSSGGEMINSELGEMPKNWEVKSVGDVLELAYGRALKETVRQAGSTPVYGSNGQIGWHNERLVKGPGIIVGRKGNPGTVLWSETDFFPIDTTFHVVPKDTAKSLYYLFYVLKNQGLALLSADSAVPGLNRNVVYMNPILVPTPTTLSQFDGIIQGLFYKVQNNNEQTAILSQIRDLLLPKLMSGKIRIPIPKENVEAS